MKQDASSYLISHNHQFAIAKFIHTGIFLAMLQTNDLFDVADFLICHDLLIVGITHVEKFTTKREYAIQITTNN